MESKNKFLVVINPISGGSGKEALLQEITAILDGSGAQYTTYETTGKDDETHIKKILDTQNIKTILVAGGDGTIQMVAKTVDNKDIGLALIPAGSANGLASNLGIPETVEDQVEIALANNFVVMDMISVNGHLCLHIADLGINAALIENYENSDIRGKLGYALQTIPTLFKTDLPYNFTLEFDDKKIDDQGVMIAFANAQQFGTGAVINPQGKIDDGKFEVLIFKKIDVIDILKTLDKDSYRDPEFVECFSTKYVTVNCEKSVPLQVDGEFIGNTQSVIVKMLPTKLKIMIPESAG